MITHLLPEPMPTESGQDLVARAQQGPPEGDAAQEAWARALLQGSLGARATVGVPLFRQILPSLVGALAEEPVRREVQRWLAGVVAQGEVSRPLLEILIEIMDEPDEARSSREGWLAAGSVEGGERWAAEALARGLPHYDEDEGEAVLALLRRTLRAGARRDPVLVGRVLDAAATDVRALLDPALRPLIVYEARRARGCEQMLPHDDPAADLPVLMDHALATGSAGLFRAVCEAGARSGAWTPDIGLRMRMVTHPNRELREAAAEVMALPGSRR